MRFIFHTIVASLLVVVTAAVIAASGLQLLKAEENSGEAEKPEADGPPPLVIDRGAPLLLDDPPAKKPEQEPLADNSACYVCHGNYEEEELVTLHALEDVGCIECHGESFDHRDDEDNVTPPDIMYSPERIEPKCQECHETHDVAARDVLARWQQRCPEKTDFKKIVCTDCHGHHRLVRRTVRWDKKTGKLLIGKADPADKDKIE